MKMFQKNKGKSKKRGKIKIKTKRKNGKKKKKEIHKAKTIRVLLAKYFLIFLHFFMFKNVLSCFDIVLQFFAMFDFFIFLILCFSF